MFMMQRLGQITAATVFKITNELQEEKQTRLSKDILQTYKYFTKIFYKLPNRANSQQTWPHFWIFFPGTQHCFVLLPISLCYIYSLHESSLYNAYKIYDINYTNNA